MQCTIYMEKWKTPDIRLSLFIDNYPKFEEHPRVAAMLQYGYRIKTFWYDWPQPKGAN